MKGNANMNRLSRDEVFNLRTIERADQLPEGATYYMDTHTEFGKYGASYSIILDKDFNAIENVTVRYTNAMLGLTRVTTKSDNIGYHCSSMVYSLKPIEGTEYFICKSISGGQ